jgi:hypothetical protein
MPSFSFSSLSSSHLPPFPPALPPQPQVNFKRWKEGDIGDRAGGEKCINVAPGGAWSEGGGGERERYAHLICYDGVGWGQGELDRSLGTEVGSLCRNIMRRNLTQRCHSIGCDLRENLIAKTRDGHSMGKRIEYGEGNEFEGWGGKFCKDNVPSLSASGGTAIKDVTLPPIVVQIVLIFHHNIL